MNLAGKHIVVVGLGRSGVAAAGLCLDRGARVTGNDAAPRERVAMGALALEQRGARLVLGGHDLVDWNAADLVVISPGVPPFPALANVERSGREVIGELELACRLVQAPIGLVGGTNGKSTVTTWLGQMLEEAGREVFVGGNLGEPLAERVGDPFDCIVLEISSFQAERIPTLRPRAAALLNITDDHLDRYDGLASYAHAKGNMFVNMEPSDVAVVPHGDGLCGEQAARGRARVVTFGPGGDVRPEGQWLVDSTQGWRFALGSIQLRGGHHVLNACASVAMAAALGASEARVAESLASFKGLAHRTTLVAQIGDVRFYDDSKGTNVGASVAALRGLAEPRAVLIAGGRDKQGSYEPLVQALRERGRALVVLGEAAERIALAAQGALETVRATSMQQAVSIAYELAKPGDAVLLSPACASFDMFTNYAHRGEVFAAAAQQLAREAGEPEVRK